MILEQQQTVKSSRVGQTQSNHTVSSKHNNCGTRSTDKYTDHDTHETKRHNYTCLSHSSLWVTLLCVKYSEWLIIVRRTQTRADVIEWAAEPFRCGGCVSVSVSVTIVLVSYRAVNGMSNSLVMNEYEEWYTSWVKCVSMLIMMITYVFVWIVFHLDAFE